MVKTVGYYVDLSTITLSDGDSPTSWVHALPGGTYKHPIYGEMIFDEPKITNLASSVTNQVRGIDPDVDYDHKKDPAMGNKAAGWIKTAEVRPSADGSKKDLYLLVEWTKPGAEKIRNKEYRYFSSEFADEWEDAHGKKHRDVLLGGGLTNRPYMKNLLPLNLSELQFSDNDPPTGGEQVDPKELRKKLGLPEAATDSEVDTKLAELVKLSETKPPGNDPTDDELKKLAEGNPLVKAFMERMATQDKQLADMQSQLTLANTTRMLTELTHNPQVQLSAAILNEARDLLVAAPQALGEKFFSVLRNIAKGEGVVLMGERGTSNPGNPTRGEGEDPAQKFNDKIAELMEKDKLPYAEAVERVALSDRQLYDEYRKSTYIKDPS